jgi:hypothetical protein
MNRRLRSFTLAVLLPVGLDACSTRMSTAPLILPAALPLVARPALALVYRAYFKRGDLAPVTDLLQLGAIKIGDSEAAGSNLSSWALTTDGLKLTMMQPAGAPVTVGVEGFVTPVSFGPRTVFGMRAVFAAAVGPHAVGNTWAVGLNARTGDEHDLLIETRTGASLQVRADGVRLNATGAAIPLNSPNLPQNNYDALMSGAEFTLEIVVDRVTGTSSVGLYGPGLDVTRTFAPSAFTVVAGPTITAIGPTIALVNGSGQPVSVRVLDFQIFK